ncbi:MAG: MCE family protein [Actinomycetes bacterium]
MTRRAPRLLRSLAAVVATAMVGSGCQFSGVGDLPLPGGVDLGDDAYEVEIEFPDVLDLVPQSSVKVNDVSVGRVEDVRLDGWHAVVTVQLRDDVRLPDNAEARLRQTSLLGEKFVSLSPPTAEQARGRLSDGDLIPLDRSGRNPEVEEVLSALSLLLNGGGVQQLQTINRELSQVMQGREERIRSVLSELDTFIGGLDQHKAEIVRAIEGLDRLSARLAAQRRTLKVALDDIPPGVKVLADQRRQLTRMLEALSDLGEVGTRVIEQSKADTIADLRALVPIVGKLAEAGHDLPRAMELLVTYPFPSTVGKGVRGDYTNLRITADLDLKNILGSLEASAPPATPELPGSGEQGGLPNPPDLDLPEDTKPDDLVNRLCNDIPDQTGLPGACTKRNLNLSGQKMPDVVKGLCSLTPRKDRAALCPDKVKDADDDGNADICVVGLVCPDKDAREEDSGGDPWEPPEDDSGAGGGLLCPPLCAARQGADDDLTRLLMGGLS